MSAESPERVVVLNDRGVTLRIARGGSSGASAPPVVVLNGTGSDLRNHPNALAWPLAKDHEILTYDHRCLGRSVQHDIDYQPNMADFALDALALCDAEGIDQFDLVGVSFGGMVAQEVAIRGADRVRRLVLCCTSSGGLGGASYPFHELYGEGGDPDAVLDLYDLRVADDETVAEQMRAIFAARPRRSEPTPGLLQQVEARRHHDTWDRLGAITAPTLVACGAHDGVAPIENSHRLTEAIPQATFASFDGGHLFLAQDRAAWSAIGEFLDN